MRTRGWIGVVVAASVVLASGVAWSVVGSYQATNLVSNGPQVPAMFNDPDLASEEDDEVPCSSSLGQNLAGKTALIEATVPTDGIGTPGPWHRHARPLGRNRPGAS